MYITRQGQMNNDFNYKKNKIKLELISNELKDLIRRIDCDLQYVNNNEPVTLETMSENIKSQLDELITFVESN